MITREQIEIMISVLLPDATIESMVNNGDIWREKHDKCVIRIWDEISVGDLHNATQTANINHYNVGMYIDGSGHPIIVIHNYENKPLN
ncbi:MAG: hypothetical protein II817_03035 [Bacteroidales bacterium]|nr:hypothetical protein [Bacteroidales bacterium]